MHPVLDLIAQRYQEDSQPLARQDAHRLVLVLEGGSSRAAYGGGMVTALEEYGLVNVFDAVYGVSAGALNGAWLICQRARANVHGWWVPESMKGSINYRNALRGRPVVNGDFILDELYETLTPMGFEDILASPVEYHPIATDCASGAAVDLAPYIHDKASLKDAMRASTRIPLLSGKPVELGGRTFLDGGLAENVPVPTALAQGATHLLVLRTKAPSLAINYEKPGKQQLVARWLRKNAPGTLNAWQDRPRMKRDIEGLMAEDRRVFQVFPPADAPKISMTANAEAQQKQAVELGHEIMMKLLAQTLPSSRD